MQGCARRQASGAGLGIKKYPVGTTNPQRTAEATQEIPRNTREQKHGFLLRSNGAISLSGFFGLKICMLKTFLSVHGVEKMFSSLKRRIHFFKKSMNCRTSFRI